MWALMWRALAWRCPRCALWLGWCLIVVCHLVAPPTLPKVLWILTYLYELMQMHGTVRELESNMEQLSLSQQYANRGIYLLCKVQAPLRHPCGGASVAEHVVLDSIGW